MNQWNARIRVSKESIMASCFVLMLAIERFTLVLVLVFMHAIMLLPAFWVMSRGKSDNNENNLITPQCTSWVHFCPH